MTRTMAVSWIASWLTCDGCLKDLGHAQGRGGVPGHEDSAHSTVVTSRAVGVSAQAGVGCTASSDQQRYRPKPYLGPLRLWFADYVECVMRSWRPPGVASMTDLGGAGGGSCFAWACGGLELP